MFQSTSSRKRIFTKGNETVESSIRWRDFVDVAKPGIVFGNAFAVVGGYFVGTGTINWTTLLSLTVGAAAIIAASCVINNYLDRDIDKHMHRTAKRPSVTGTIPLDIAMYYATLLYAVGFGLLLWQTNMMVVLLGLACALLYTVVYGYAKRHTHYATLIGAVPGALPPAIGYVAAVGTFDLGATLLFLIMFSWQIPHFYAIAIRRQQDYQRAGIPVMPAAKGLPRTVWEMRFFGIAFIVLCFLLSRLGYTGFMFGLGMVAVGLYWLVPMFSPDWRTHTVETAKLVFKRSMLVLMTLCSFWALTHVLL